MTVKAAQKAEAHFLIEQPQAHKTETKPSRFNQEIAENIGETQEGKIVREKRNFHEKTINFD